MHLLCRDTECVGNDLPAGTVGSDYCRFCEKPLADERGHVLAQGAAPLVDGEPPTSVDSLMDALRDAGLEVQVVDLSAVRVDGKLLVSAVAEDGELITASVMDGGDAAAVEHMMDLLAED